MESVILNAIGELRRRREALGMGFPALAARSGISVATVKRIFSGRGGSAVLEHFVAVAEALGVKLNFGEIDAEEFRRAQARRKAEHIAALVQGTSALEGQAVDEQTYRRLVERTYHELLAGPNRKLWSE